MGVGFGPFKFVRADITSYAPGSTNNDQATTQPFSRVGSSSGSANLTGLASPVAGQLRLLTWNRSGTVVVQNNVTSTAANRFLLIADATLSSATRKGLLLFYDGTSARWRGVS